MQMTSRFASALVYACEIHAGQLRKGTDIPYISHLLAVTSIALDHGATEDEAIGALLHDLTLIIIVGQVLSAIQGFQNPWAVRQKVAAPHLGEGGAQSPVLQSAQHCNLFRKTLQKVRLHRCHRLPKNPSRSGHKTG